MVKLISRWGPALAVMLVIFFSSSQTKGSELMPDFGGWHDLIVKKGAHFLIYALLGLALLRGLRGGRPSQRGDYLLAVVFALIYALGDEYHQTFVAGRDGNWHDVVLDTFGAGAALVADYARNKYSPQFHFGRVRSGRTGTG